MRKTCDNINIFTSMKKSFTALIGYKHNDLCDVRISLPVGMPPARISTFVYSIGLQEPFNSHKEKETE